MVWFQCEDCGENLKKPKLSNHFRCCSAYKLSCIDCGETFGQQSVQGHNQCITEAEKYGPKDQGKASNGTTPKAKNNSKNPDIDINVGLTERPPWYCSLCNTNATSQQALLLHAEGKKHRAKARAFHAANQQSKQTEESTPNPNITTVSTQKDVKESKEEDSTKVALANNSSEAENGNLPTNRKRKSDPSENGRARKKVGHDTTVELGNGEVMRIGRAEKEVKDDEVVKSISAKEDSKQKIKWKKFITTALRSSPDGVMKMRKLRKLALKAIQESGITEDEVQLSNMLENKIKSSSRFTVDNKYVHLVAKN